MPSMLGLPQCHGLRLTWMRMSGAVDDTNCPSFITTVIGSRQHAQYDSRVRSRSAKGGIFDTAVASMAQPAKEWKLPSRWTSTWLGYDENGWTLSRLAFIEVSSNTTISPRSSSLYVS